MSDRWSNLPVALIPVALFSRSPVGTVALMAAMALVLLGNEPLWAEVLPLKTRREPVTADSARAAKPGRGVLQRARRGVPRRIGSATPASASIRQPTAPLPPLQRRRTESPEDDEKPIGALSIDSLPSRGELPPNYAAARFSREGEVFHRTGTSRPWMGAVYHWEASAFCHRELHFEEPNLERLGHSFGMLQPAVSGAHFFARIAALPYSTTAYPATECVYSLGHYRPGNYAPFQYIRLPLSLPAAAVQTGTVLGLVYLIP